MQYVDIPSFRVAHGITWGTWAGKVVKRGLDRLIPFDTRGGRGSVHVKSLMGGKGGAWIEGHMGHAGSPLDASTVRALAIALTQAADAIEEWESDRTPEV